MKYIIASGYFDPLHPGHLNMLEEAKEYGDELIVIVNNDRQANIKKGYNFMNEKDRCKIIKSLKIVDRVVLSHDEDKSVRETLASIFHSVDFNDEDEWIFANGGDRKEDEIPETEVCDALGIEMYFDVGGGKYASSSELINKVKKT